VGVPRRPTNPYRSRRALSSVPDEASRRPTHRRWGSKGKKATRDERVGEKERQGSGKKHSDESKSKAGNRGSEENRGRLRAKAEKLRKLI